MLPFPLIYHERYDLHLGEHVFPSKKYRWLKDRMLRTRFAEPADFVEPEAANDDDLRLVHDADWVAKLRTGTLSYQYILRLEIPYSPQMVEAFWLAAGGSMLAARLAMEDGIGLNVGGGFHHAFPGHGEGFCAINDIAIAVRRLQADGRIKRAMVVDCDVHPGGAPGNGGRNRAQRRRRVSPRVPWPRRGVLRHQRYRHRGAAAISL